MDTWGVATGFVLSGFQPVADETDGEEYCFLSGKFRDVVLPDATPEESHIFRRKAMWKSIRLRRSCTSIPNLRQFIVFLQLPD